MHRHEVELSTRLQALIDHRDLDTLLSAVSLAEVAEAWHCYHHRDGSDDSDWWAIELWLSASPIWDNDDLARAGLLALIDAADGDAELNNVGAGPLETYIDDDESRLVWIEQHAQQSAKFRSALAAVWVWGSLSDRASARIEQAAGVPLARPTQ